MLRLDYRGGSLGVVRSHGGPWDRVIATGAGAEMRRSLGVAVFSGMIGVTLFGIFLTPVFFYVIQGLGESRLFASERSRRWGSIAALALMGAAAGFLLDRIGVARMPWSMLVGAGAGVVIALAAAEVRRRVRPLIDGRAEGRK